ncbi:DUF4843 domain-containing protein [Marinifilum sp.]|uniref:DUF4843 domain-containing protein n=1 Tax=Marinifilum sp. TaxID=2033137 RepID=UPI003BA8C6BB
MKFKYICLTLIVLFATYACNTDDPIEYIGVDYVYFESEEEEGTLLEKSFTFLFEEETTTSKELEIPVAASGMLVDSDRLFSISIIDSLTTATEGTHFSIDPAKLVIKAGEINGNVLVTLNRTAEMKDTVYTIGIELSKNDQFDRGFRTVCKVKFSDLFLEPEWWYSSWQNIGPFTTTKGLLWLEYHEVTDGSDPIEIYYDDDFGMYAREEFNAIKEGFKQWLTNHPEAPIYDENEDLVASTL